MYCELWGLITRKEGRYVDFTLGGLMDQVLSLQNIRV